MAPTPQVPAKIVLKEPINHGGQNITELTIKKPTLKHMRDIKAGETPTLGQIGDILSSLTDQPPSVIGELGMEDMMACAEILSGFFPSFPSTGKMQ